ncbi:MAG: hypothetical protein AB7F96_09935 [Beijerinckiaceae bacterium]
MSSHIDVSAEALRAAENQVVASAVGRSLKQKLSNSPDAGVPDELNRLMADMEQIAHMQRISEAGLRAVEAALFPESVAAAALPGRC